MINESSLMEKRFDAEKSDCYSRLQAKVISNCEMFWVLLLVVVLRMKRGSLPWDATNDIYSIQQRASGVIVPSV